MIIDLFDTFAVVVMTVSVILVGCVCLHVYVTKPKGELNKK